MSKDFHHACRKLYHGITALEEFALQLKQFRTVEKWQDLPRNNKPYHLQLFPFSNQVESILTVLFI